MNDGRANLVESPTVRSAERNRRQTTKSFDDCCVMVVLFVNWNFEFCFKRCYQIGGAGMETKVTITTDKLISINFETHATHESDI